MKFYCDSCQTKYSIADEKVRGKVLKVRCKKCSHVITVREPRRQQPQSNRPSPGAAQAEWHYSINGESFGPISEAEVRAKIKSGELKEAFYLWKAGFGDWLPLSEVELFADTLAEAHAEKPPPKTLGAGDELEAVNLKDHGETPVAEVEQEGASKPGGARGSTGAGQPSAAQKLREKLRANRAGTSAPTGEAQDQPAEEKSQGDTESASPSEEDEVSPKPIGGVDPLGKAGEQEAGRKDRLNQLRSRLRLDDAPDDDESVDVDGGEQDLENLPDLSADLAVEESEPELDPEPMREPEPEPEAKPELESEPDPEPEPIGSDEDVASHDGLFASMDGPSSAASPVDEAPAVEADGVDGDETEADDAVPFFPSSAPKLGAGEDEDADRSTSMSRVDEMTGSLLIQINEIKSDGRKRAIVGTLGAVVALLIVGGVGYIAWTQTGSSEVEEEVRSGPRADHVGAQPEFRTYDREDLDRFRDQFMVEEEVVISREDSRAAYERDQAAEADEGAQQPAPQGEASEEGSDGMPSFDMDSISDDDLAALEGDRAETGDGLGSRGVGDGAMAGLGEMEDGLSGLDDLDEADRDRFERMAALQGDTSGVFEGDGEFDGSRSGRRTELSPIDISRGIGHVMESVGICRERHLARGGGELEETELEVHMIVDPDGSVGEFSLHRQGEAPGARVLEDTLFERCMNSHTGRWRFPPYDGDPQPVGAPFTLR